MALALQLISRGMISRILLSSGLDLALKRLVLKNVGALRVWIGTFVHIPIHLSFVFP